MSTTAPKATAVAVTSQSRHPWRATLRTALAVLAGLAALVPAALEAIAQGDASTLGPWAVLALTISGAVTRVLALPQVEAFLAAFAPWLAADPGAGALATVPKLALTADQRTDLTILRDALEPGDPARTALNLVLDVDDPTPRRRHLE